VLEKPLEHPLKKPLSPISVRRTIRPKKNVSGISEKQSF